jgi:hypothetical protein
MAPWQFKTNLEAKIEDPEFINDIKLLIRPGLEYDPRVAKILQNVEDPP